MKIMKMGLKWVVVRSYGLILWENEATRSKMLSKYLRTTGSFIINSKTTEPIKKNKSSFSIYGRVNTGIRKDIEGYTPYSYHPR